MTDSFEFLGLVKAFRDRTTVGALVLRPGCELIGQEFVSSALPKGEPTNAQGASTATLHATLQGPLT